MGTVSSSWHLSAEGTRQLQRMVSDVLITYSSRLEIDGAVSLIDQSSTESQPVEFRQPRPYVHRATAPVRLTSQRSRADARVSSSSAAQERRINRKSHQPCERYEFVIFFRPCFVLSRTTGKTIQEYWNVIKSCVLSNTHLETTQRYSNRATVTCFE